MRWKQKPMSWLAAFTAPALTGFALVLVAGSGSPRAENIPTPRDEAQAIAKEVREDIAKPARRMDMEDVVRRIGDDIKTREDAIQAIAKETVEGVGTGNDAELEAWTRSILERALNRAGDSAREQIPKPGSSAPSANPGTEAAAKAIASGFAKRPRTGEVLVFVSLSLPDTVWQPWAEEAARLEVPLVLRGILPEGLKATVARAGDRLGETGGAVIDPRLFHMFDVQRVPAVAVVPGGLAPCESRGCADDTPPPHDIVTGNTGLAAALEIIAAEGEPGRMAARKYLATLQGDLP